MPRTNRQIRNEVSFLNRGFLTRRQALELFDMGRVSEKMALYRLRRLAKKLDTLALKRKRLTLPRPSAGGSPQRNTWRESGPPTGQDQGVKPTLPKQKNPPSR